MRPCQHRRGPLTVDLDVALSALACVDLGEPGPRPDWLNTATTIAAVQAVLVGLATLALLTTAVRILRRLPARATTASPGPGPALRG